MTHYDILDTIHRQSPKFPISNSVLSPPCFPKVFGAAPPVLEIDESDEDTSCELPLMTDHCQSLTIPESKLPPRTKALNHSVESLIPSRMLSTMNPLDVETIALD